MVLKAQLLLPKTVECGYINAGVALEKLLPYFNTGKGNGATSTNLAERNGRKKNEQENCWKKPTTKLWHLAEAVMPEKG